MLGSTECKRIAVRIIAPKDYGGLAGATVEVVTLLDVRVVDRPVAEYNGHAEIEYGIRRPIDAEPLDPESSARLNELTTPLARRFLYRMDPDVASPVWTGTAPCGASTHDGPTPCAP